MNQIEHRPWPCPKRLWLARQDWTELTFLHWRVPVSVLRAQIPKELEIDTYEGDAWLGLVPFRMENVRFRFTPKVPWLSSFPELNVRTYVKHRGKPGVYFFSLDAASRLMVWIGRQFFHLPYFKAAMTNAPEQSGWQYFSARKGSSPGAHRFVARQRFSKDVFLAQPGSVEHFLTERYCLYSLDKRGQVLCSEVHHVPWPLRCGEIEIEENTMLQGFGIDSSRAPDLVHASDGVEVTGWWPERSMKDTL